MTTLHRHLLLALMVAVVLAAVVASARLGNPLGRAIGKESFPQRSESGSAVIESASPDRRMAPLAEYTARWQLGLVGVLGLPARPVTIRLFDSRDHYIEGCTGTVPGFVAAMDWCYDPSAMVIYGWWADQDDLQRHLRHELLHHAVSHLRDLPPWLEEGTAELLEQADVDAQGRIVIGGVQRDRLKYAARRLGSDFTLEGLLSTDAAAFRGRNRDVWYSLGYSITTWLLTTEQLPQALAVGRSPQLADPAQREDAHGFARSPERWRAAIGHVLPRQEIAGPGAAAAVGAVVAP
jgi:heme-degrading monooxygenase HmoA